MQSSFIAGRLIQVLFAFLLVGAAFLLGSQVAGEEYQNIGFFAAIAAGLAFYLFAGKFFWAICFAVIFIPINLPFVPLGMKPFEIMLAAALGYYLINDLAFKKKFPLLGVRPDGIFLAAALCFVLYHGIDQRFGVRLLGSELWGGRAYLGMIGAALAYFCLQSTHLPTKLWNKLPWIILFFGTLNFLFKLGLQLSPSAFAFVIPYEEFQDNEFSRWGFLGDYGYLLIVTAFSMIPIYRWLSSRNLWPFLMGTTGVFLCFLSGYRSSSMNALIYFLVGSWRDLKMGVIIIPIGFVLVATVLSISHSTFLTLPPGIQRGLVWIPGDWDYQVKMDAEGSNDFRLKVWEYFLVHEFPNHMWFGRGLAVPYREILKNLGSTTIDPETGQARQVLEDRDYAFFVTGNLHNGFLSTLDRFGIVGALFIFLFILVAFMRFLGFIMKNPPNRGNFALQWIALYGTVSIIGFPMGAPRIDDFLPTIFILLGVFNALKASYDRELASQPPAPDKPLPIAKLPTTFQTTFR